MNHIMDILPKFRGLVEKLEEIKKEIVEQSGIDYTSQDARMVALDSIQISISAVGMHINAINSLGNVHTKNGNFDEINFLKSVGSGVNISQTEEIMFSHLRLGFMTLVHFKIDNLIHNILKDMNSLPSRPGYWNLTDKILEVCSIAKRGIEKDRLSAFANLRNSLHGNGIHRTPTLCIEVNTTKFDFIKDSRVECAGWEHIVTLLDSNIDILKRILLSSVVTNIKTEILDDYASGK
jgi:hypothetical protein